MVKFIDEKDIPVDAQISPETDPVKTPGVVFLADSHQPKDIYSQLDSTVRDMKENFATEPYTSNAYKSVMQSLPILDPLTKKQLSEGDTTNLKEVYLTPAFHYINQRLFNYPRAIAERQGYGYPEAETLPGQILSKGAGIAGAVQSFDVGKKAAAKVIPYQKLAGKSLGKATARGTVAGAAQGAVYAPEDLLDMKVRLYQAITGAAVGSIVSPVTEKIANFIRKKALRGKTTIKGRITNRRADADYRRTTGQIREDTVVNEATDLLKQNQNELQDIVAIQQVQGKIPKTEAAFKQWSKNLSKTYETTVDDISKDIGEIDTSMAGDYFDDFLNGIKTDAGLAETTAAKRVQSFVNTIKNKKNVKFKDLNALRREILKKKFKGDIDDVVYTRFRKSFAEFAETVDDTGRFAKLNETMSPQLDFKHKFITKTKAFDKYDTKGLESLMKKYAERKTNPKGISAGEIALMDDAMKYVGKYGMKTSDLEAIYAGEKLSKSVSEKIKSGVKSSKTTSKLEDAVRTKIRTKQDVKLGQLKNTEIGRILYQTVNTAIRLSLAGMIMNSFRQAKEGLSFENKETSTNF